MGYSSAVTGTIDLPGTDSLSQARGSSELCPCPWPDSWAWGLLSPPPSGCGGGGGGLGAGVVGPGGGGLDGFSCTGGTS